MISLTKKRIALISIQGDPLWKLAKKKRAGKMYVRQQLGHTARQRVATYCSWDGIASQLSQLYTQLLEQLALQLDPASAYSNPI